MIDESRRKGAAPTIATRGRCRTSAVRLPVIVAALVFASLAWANPPVTVEDAWVRVAPPGARILSAYMTLDNTTRRRIAVVAVESPQFERVEIHRSFTVDGVSRMERIRSLDLPRRGRVALEPGGLHLMLFLPHEPVKEGDKIDLTLVMDNDWHLDLTVPVVGTRPQAR